MEDNSVRMKAYLNNKQLFKENNDKVRSQLDNLVRFMFNKGKQEGNRTAKAGVLHAFGYGSNIFNPATKNIDLIMIVEDTERFH